MQASRGFFNREVPRIQGVGNVPTIKNVKEKTKKEAKKAAGEAKRIGAKALQEAKKGAADVKKAGSKVASETKKEVKKARKKT